MESIVHQIKDRETKLYTSKVEIHLSSTKENTSIPKIDALSRMIAEEVTRREIKHLGIKTKDPNPKSFLPTSPKFKSSPKRNTQKSQSKPAELAKSEESSPLEAKFEVLVSPAVDEPCPRRSKTEIVTPNDLIIVQEQINIRQLKRKKTMETMDNLHNLNAFREELQKDYPELELDVSCEASSFRTEELYEIESHSHEAPHERHDIKVSPVPYLNTEDSRIDGNGLKKLEETSEVFNQVEKNEQVENLNQENNEIEKHDKEKISQNEKKNFKKGILKNIKPLEIKESISAISVKTKFELSPTHSNIVSLLSEQGNFTGVNSSYLKASYLHTAQESINSSVPRCHLNLSNCKSTPVYYSVRLSGDSKVKTCNGIGSVNSLRHFLLNDEGRPKASTPKDMYSKNMEWSAKKQKRIKKLRKSIDLKEQEKCTFNPFFHNKRSETQLFESKSSFFSPKSSFIQASILKISSKPPEALLNYLPLSPANASIRYSEGCNVNKMIKTAKPMVNYRQINLLK